MTPRDEDPQSGVATREAVVRHAQGLHARPAEGIARLARRYVASVSILHGEHRVDAKSILDVLTLGAVCGTTLIVEARGPDAQQAAEEVSRLVESDFPTPAENGEAQGEAARRTTPEG